MFSAFYHSVGPRTNSYVQISLYIKFYESQYPKTFYYKLPFVLFDVKPRSANYLFNRFAYQYRALKWPASMLIYWKKKTAFTWEKSSTPRRLAGYTNKAAVSLFWNTNSMAAVTSCESALLNYKLSLHKVHKQCSLRSGIVQCIHWEMCDRLYRRQFINITLKKSFPKKANSGSKN